MATDPEVLSPEREQPAGLEKKEMASDVLASIGAAQVSARYGMAMKNPRDWKEVRSRILNACERPYFADSALYKKPIGQGSVTGLSIRFAEEAQRCMRNIMPERTVVFDDTSKRVIRMAITDLENNVTHYKDLILEKTVERKDKRGRKVLSHRTNSQGEITYLVEATEDDLLTKESAISSKIERQLTLKILPGDIQEEALDKIRETQRKRDKADPEAAKNKLIDGFDDLGVRVKDLKEFLGAESLDNIQPKDLQALRAIWQAINEGETNWREVMEARTAARGGAASTGTASADTSTAAGKAKEAAKKAAAKTQPATPAGQETQAAKATEQPETKPEPTQDPEPDRPAPPADDKDDW